MSHYPQAELVPKQNGYRSAPQSTSGLAITSLVLGISSFICVIFTGSLAVILGILALTKISKSNGRLAGNGMAIAGIVTGAMGCLWTVIMVALLLPAVQQVRIAARRTTTMNHVRQICLANLNYESTNRRFASNFAPTAPDAGENLSWRVHLLPYFGEDQLYSKFRLDEPWDSAHNKALIAEIPVFYQHPQWQPDLQAGFTVFQFPVSPASSSEPALYVEGEQGASFADLSDGSSNTIMVLEVSAAAAVPWTKPQDWRFDPNNPNSAVGDAFPGGFVAGYCDGSTHFMNDEMSPAVLKALFTRSAGDQ